MSFYALPVHMGTDRNMIIKHPPEHFAMESNISSHRESERQRQSEREREVELENFILQGEGGAKATGQYTRMGWRKGNS